MLQKIAANPYEHVVLHPNIYKKLMDNMLKRLEEEVTPQEWENWQLSCGEVDDEFTSKTIDLSREVVRQYYIEIKKESVDEELIRHFAECLWYDSQNHFSSISEIINKQINFVRTLLDRAKKEIDDIFPNCCNIFDERAYQLLIDLSFQSNIYGYTQLDERWTVDNRRMINIAGQVVEEIFSTKIFGKEMTVGEICRELEDIRNNKSENRHAFFTKLPNGRKIQTKEFIGNFKKVVKTRNNYSHGTTKDYSVKSDLSEYINVLFFGKSAVLKVMYELLLENRSPVNQSIIREKSETNSH